MNTADFMKDLFSGDSQKMWESVKELTKPQPQPGKFCSAHGRSAVVMYSGPACPYCVTLDDLDFTRTRLQNVERQLEANVSQGDSR